MAQITTTPIEDEYKGNDQLRQRDDQRYGPDPAAEARREHRLLIDGVPFNQWWEARLLARKICVAYQEFLEGQWPALESIEWESKMYCLADYGLADVFIDTEYSRKKNTELAFVCIRNKVNKESIIKGIEKYGKASRCSKCHEPTELGNSCCGDEYVKTE